MTTLQRRYGTSPLATYGGAILAAVALLGGCVGDIDAAGEPMMQGASSPREAGDAYAITSSNRLISFDQATGEIVDAMDIVGLGADDWIVGADIRPADNNLYALARSGKLYAFDLRRAGLLVRATLQADTNDATDPFAELQGEAFGVSFNPVADRLRVIGSGGQNLRVNVDTGAVTTDTALDRDAGFLPAATYSNPFAEACRTQLYVLDASAPDTEFLIATERLDPWPLNSIDELRALVEAHRRRGYQPVFERDGWIILRRPIAPRP